MNFFCIPYSYRYFDSIYSENVSAQVFNLSAGQRKLALAGGLTCSGKTNLTNLRVEGEWRRVLDGVTT